MSSATRGSVRRRWRKARSAVGSATCVPFTRSTTAPLPRPSLAALQADAPEAEPRVAARPVATAPRRVEDVALGDQRVVGEGSGGVRGDRGGGFSGRGGHVVDGRAETGRDSNRGQVRDEREEGELEGEPVTPDGPHRGTAGSYASSSRRRNGFRSRTSG